MVPSGQRGQFGQDVAEVCERILAVALAGGERRVGDRRTLARCGAPDEEPVRPPHRGGSDRIFDRLLSTRLKEWFGAATSTSQGLSSYEHALQPGIVFRT
jgi:hypothetical protein